MNDTDQRRGGWEWLTWLVLGAGFLLAVAVILPNFVRARVTSAPNACINNLRQIDGAKQQFALEKQLTNGAPVAWTNLVGGDAYLRTQPVCPQVGVYTLNPIGTSPVCSNPGHALPP